MKVSFLADEMPPTCEACILHLNSTAQRLKCRITEKSVGMSGTIRRPKWCPLETAPKNDDYQRGFYAGRMACLEDIKEAFSQEQSG